MSRKIYIRKVGEKIMTDLQTSKTGIIRVTKTNFKGKDYLDIRKYYLDKETEEYKPTRKGCTIPLNLIEKIKEAITKEV